MKRFKKICIAGLAAFMLSFSLWGMSAEAVTGCGHVWTAEEFFYDVVIGTEEHTHNNGRECTIKYMQDVCRTRCRACGEVVGMVEGAVREVHIFHLMI